MGVAANTFIEYEILAVALLLYYVKSFKYFVLAPTIGPLVKALVSTALSLDVLIFVAVLLFILVAIAMMHWIAFGHLVEDYHTLEQSVVNAAYTAYGDTFIDIREASPNVSVILGFLVMFFVPILMMNILIAVISNVYDRVMETNLADWEQTLTDRMVSEANDQSLARFYEDLQKMFDPLDVIPDNYENSLVVSNHNGFPARAQEQFDAWMNSKADTSGGVETENSVK